MGPDMSEWIEDAQSDLTTARDLLANGHYNWAVFCARTAVEKALRAAYPPIHKTRMPKDHDLLALSRCCFGEGPKAVEDGLRYLDPHRVATEKAHAAEGPPSAVYTRRTAEKALQYAGQLMGWIQAEVSAASEHLRKGT
jgi:HEPN domain-containing protein